MGNNGTDRPAVVIWYWIWFALDTEIGNESVVVRRSRSRDRARRTADSGRRGIGSEDTDRRDRDERKTAQGDGKVEAGDKGKAPGAAVSFKPSGGGDFKPNRNGPYAGGRKWCIHHFAGDRRGCDAGDNCKWSHKDADAPEKLRKN